MYALSQTIQPLKVFHLRLLLTTFVLSARTLNSLTTWARLRKCPPRLPLYTLRLAWPDFLLNHYKVEKLQQRLPQATNLLEFQIHQKIMSSNVRVIRPKILDFQARAQNRAIQRLA